MSPTSIISFLLAVINIVNAQATSTTLYAPSSVACPTGSLVRNAGTPESHNQTLHSEEVAYVRTREGITSEALEKWLHDIPEAVYEGNIADDVPNIALALSGGNFRAALFNAAGLEAFDARNTSSVSRGLGGLLQFSTYISALSGGSYVVASLMFNEFATGHDLVFGNNASGTPGWQLEQSLLQPGSSQDTTAFVGHLVDDLAAKRFGANMTVTFCDFWGRALAYHFLPGTPPDSFASNTTATNHAAALTFSSATNLTSWKNHSLPFPLVVMNVNSPNVHGQPFGGNGTLSLQTVVYEMSPFEFGSYEPQLASFVSLPFLGSTLFDGQAAHCVNGFDNAGLMIGTSSCDFNPLNVTMSPEWTSPDELGGFVDIINSTFGALQPDQEMDVTSVPNPFYKMHVGEYQDANETALALLDGSLDDENDPLFPLLVKERKVDMVVVLDSSGETSNFKPTGQSLIATKLKTTMLPHGFMNFPRPFPDTIDDFVSLGLNTRPVFFGCDGAGNTDDQFPVLVYIPNDDPDNITNIVTSTLQLPVVNQSVIFDRSYLLASRGFVNASDDLNQSDSQWGTCVACAAVERARGRQGVLRTSTCETCFARYCYTGQRAAAWPTVSTSAAAHTFSLMANVAAVEQTTDAAQPYGAILVRNSYIAIGLLGAVLVTSCIAGAVLFKVLRGSKGYVPLRSEPRI